MYNVQTIISRCFAHLYEPGVLPIGISILRIFRVLRPFRAVRISGLYVSNSCMLICNPTPREYHPSPQYRYFFPLSLCFPQLVVTGLISSIKSMGSVLLVTLLVLLIFAVIGVDIFRVSRATIPKSSYRKSGNHRYKNISRSTVIIMYVVCTGTILLLY